MWCPEGDYAEFALVDDGGLVLACGRPLAGLAAALPALAEWKVRCTSKLQPPAPTPLHPSKH